MPQVILAGTGVVGTGDINGRPANHSDVQPVTKTAETISTAEMRNRYGSLMLLHYISDSQYGLMNPPPARVRKSSDEEY